MQIFKYMCLPRKLTCVEMQGEDWTEGHSCRKSGADNSFTWDIIFWWNPFIRSLWQDQKWFPLLQEGEIWVSHHHYIYYHLVFTILPFFYLNLSLIPIIVVLLSFLSKNPALYGELAKGQSPKVPFSVVFMSLISTHK